ncbi:reverse transcriptase domain-containing protein [Tanacetum coccineum]
MVIYDMGVNGFEQYFQVQDYALWDVIENGNSFKPAAPTITNADGTSTSLIPGPVTTKEKAQKKNNVKARNTMIFNDLYNNFKIVEQEVEGTTSSSSSSQNMDFVSSPSSTNEVNTAYGVSTTNTQVSPTSPPRLALLNSVSTANLNKIHEDDIEEMDLKWQLALLSMRTKRWDTLQGNAEDLGTKIAGTGIKTALRKDNKCGRKLRAKAWWLLMEFVFERSYNGRLMIRKGVGFVNYNAVPPSPTGLFSLPKFDLSNSGLEDFQQPKFKGYGSKTSKSVSEDISNEVRESPDAPLVEELVSNDNLEKKTVFPIVTKIEFIRPKQQEKPVRKPVKADVQLPINRKGVSREYLYKVEFKYNYKKAHPSAHKTMRPKVVNTTRPNSTVVNAVRENQVNAVKALTCWVWRPTKLNSHPQKEDQGYIESGCSRHMTGNMSYLSYFKEFDGGYVTFGGGAKKGKITGKGTFKTGCFVRPPDFKLADESQVLLKVPRKNNMYSVDMKNIVPKESLNLTFAMPHLDTSMLMAPKRTSSSAAPPMTQAAIKKQVADSVAAALEAQAATIANTDNTTRNTRQRETPIARKCSYTEFMNCQPFNFKGMEGAVGLIRWFKKTELVFLRSNCTEDCKVKFATGTLTEEALSWWNSFAQPIGIEEAYKISWSEFKKLLIKKYCPRTEVKKMEDEFYNLTVKGNDLKTYIRRFQELAILCPPMVPNSEKLMQVFIGGLPRSIEGNFDDRRNTTDNNNYHNNRNNNNYQNNRNNNNINRNNDHHQQQNRRQETVRDYAAPQLKTVGVDKSFVSISLASMLNISPITLDTTYDIKMVDGNLVGTNTVIQGCTLILLNQPFKIDLMLIKLGSFVVVIGMDWLSKYHARTIYDEKVVHIPIDSETLIIRAQVMEKKSDEKLLEDIPVVRELLEVFSENLPGLPLVRQVEFQIDLIPGAAPVARAPYRLASSKIQEAIKEENIKAENLRGMDKAFEVRPNGTRCIKNRSWLPPFGNLRDLIMQESHKSKYSIYLGSDKMYQDLKKLYWWPNMKEIIAEYVSKCLICSRVKAECHKSSGLLIQPEIPTWKWERITMDFVTKLPKTSSGHDTIWVIVDRLTKSAYFIPTKVADSMETLTRLYIKEIVSWHEVPISIISDRDSHFTSRFWQSM